MQFGDKTWEPQHAWRFFKNRYLDLDVGHRIWFYFYLINVIINFSWPKFPYVWHKETGPDKHCSESTYMIRMKIIFCSQIKHISFKLGKIFQKNLKSNTLIKRIAAYNINIYFRIQYIQPQSLFSFMFRKMKS